MSQSGAVGRGAAARRYPALVWLVGAGLLALLLPSGLTLPQTGPPTLAELAPVPGAGEGVGDLTELGQPSSRGIGSGPGGGGDGGGAGTPHEAAAEALPTGPGRVIRKPGTKRCVGKPPRQTEDPLSPPCVAFFEGDNGGATARGVTADEVVVVSRFNNTASDPRSNAAVECNGEPEEEDTFEDALCRAYTRYFNDRYQTYGRTVRVINAHIGVPDSSVRDRYQPFGNATQGSPAQAWARSGTVTVGFMGTARTRTQQMAPYGASFRPDDEDQEEQIATFLCQKLLGRPARYAGDPRLATRNRKLGVLWVTGQDRRKDVIRAQVRSICGADIASETSQYTDPTGVAKLQTDGVTTVIMLVGNTAHATAAAHATNLGYFPEWFVPSSTGLNGIDVNFHARTAQPAQWRNAFGLTLDIRRQELAEQPWYRAYKEACGPCPEPQFGQSGVLFAAAAYDAMALLFYGIQVAGPRLTAENIDKGLHAIPARPSDDPFRPAAYFAPGNHSFLKDAMPIWWDPTGRPPGSAATGCYRLPRDGRRYRSGEWPNGDDDIQMMGPCQADTFQ